MKNRLIALSLILFIFGLTGNAFAFNETDAVKLVKAYSEIVACQQEQKYEAVKVAGAPDVSEMDDMYVVFWEGDFGCYGGRATGGRPNFTVVKIAAFNIPVVLPDYEMPEMDLAFVTKLSIKNRIFFIEGVTYGPEDNVINPTKKVKFTLKFDPETNKFIKQ